MTQFKSRKAAVSCSKEEFYSFITDLRNFGDLVPDRSIGGWQFDKETCRFKVDPIGEVALKVASKTPFDLVKFSGTVLGSTTFELQVSILGEIEKKSSVELLMEAELSPLLLMVASGPIEGFLEALVKEMEMFSGWKQ